jgi:integrase
MKLYRATFKNEAGEEQKTPKWYLDFFDHNQIRRRLKALKSEKLSAEFGRNIETLVECRLSGRTPDSKLNQWIEGLPSDLLKKFVSWGLLDGSRIEITKPLKDHIEDYAQILESKGYSRHYTVQAKNILKTILTDCRFVYFRDIQKSAVELYLGKMKKDGYSDTTRGHYLCALKAFCNWAWDDQRILSNPIAKMEKPARDSKRKGVLTPEQFVFLIKTTFEKNIIIHDTRRGTTTGQERAVLYLVSGCTGLRKKELLDLLWSDMHLTGNAFVLVRAAIAKNAKEARQPLPPIAVGLLNALLRHTNAKPDDRVFASFSKWINTAGLIRHDLEVAKIPLHDREGNEIVFHSLRNSYISFLANSATPAKVIQQLARHSDPRLTFNTYARTFEAAEQNAMSVLPNFGAFYFDTYFDKKGTLAGACIEAHRGKSVDIELKTPLPQNFERTRQDSDLQP